MRLSFVCYTVVLYVLLIQRQIKFSELTDVEAIAEGGFGVIHRAKHPEWGTVVYKELKSSIIPDGSKFVTHVLYFVVTNNSVRAI